MIGKARAEEILRACRDSEVLVVGDIMLDRYITGTVARISPEAPVPVVRVASESSRPGGAANVALNVRSLGGGARLVGTVGADAAGEEVLRLLERAGVEVGSVACSPRVRTTVKTRIVAERQQVVRVDTEDGPGRMAAEADALCAALRGLPAEPRGVIVEDYGKGVISQSVVDEALAMAGRHGVPVGYDPDDHGQIRIGSLALATPNYREACAAAGIRERELGPDPASDPSLAAAAETLIERWGCALLLITLGPQGMYLRRAGGEAECMPTKAREVFDVSGAGDTVVAAALLALASGAGAREAVALANTAAGVVVGKLGTATCTPEEILAELAVFKGPKT